MDPLRRGRRPEPLRRHQPIPGAYRSAASIRSSPFKIRSRAFRGRSSPPTTACTPPSTTAPATCRPDDRLQRGRQRLAQRRPPDRPGKPGCDSAQPICRGELAPSWPRSHLRHHASLGHRSVGRERREPVLTAANFTGPTSDPTGYYGDLSYNVEISRGQQLQTGVDRGGAQGLATQQNLPVCQSLQSHRAPKRRRALRLSLQRGPLRPRRPPHHRQRPGQRHRHRPTSSILNVRRRRLARPGRLAVPRRLQPRRQPAQSADR